MFCVLSILSQQLKWFEGVLARNCKWVEVNGVIYNFQGYLGDNDQAARVLVVQHPREQGEWCSQNPSVERVLT